jgi:hypothetical protein
VTAHTMSGQANTLGICQVVLFQRGDEIKDVVGIISGVVPAHSLALGLTVAAVVRPEYQKPGLGPGSIKILVVVAGGLILGWREIAVQQNDNRVTARRRGRVGPGLERVFGEAVGSKRHH